MMKIKTIFVVGTTLCMLVGCLSVLGFNAIEKTRVTRGDPSETSVNPNNKESHVTLACDLPTEQPIVSIYETSVTNISDLAVAREYAKINYPELVQSTDLGRYDPNLDMYIFLINDTHKIKISPTGYIIYSGHTEETKVKMTEFPKTKAIEIATNFSIAHGGLDNYSLDWAKAIEINKDGVVTDETYGYSVVFRREIDGLQVLGSESIRVDINGLGEVYHFTKHERIIGEAHFEANVISSSDAYSTLTESVTTQFTVTEVKLCYYSMRQTENQTITQPAWAFSDGETIYYVSATDGAFLT